jgi:hypothetical protein
MVCGAKRIRSIYLLWMTGVTPKLSTTTPPRGLVSLFTINGATMRLCRADFPASAHSHRGWKPLPQRPSSPSLRLGQKDDHPHDFATAPRA